MCVYIFNYNYYVNQCYNKDGDKMKHNNKTMPEIAKRANLSIATVSRYFNNPDLVAAKSKHKIEAVIEELNYSKNRYAKVLSTGTTDLIGIIIPNMTYDFYDNVLQELLLYADACNLQCIVFSSNSDSIKEKKYIRELSSYQVKGIINLSNTIDSLTLSKLHPNIIGIERECKHIKGVYSDNYHGGLLQAKTLHTNRCDTIFYCSSSSSSERTANKRLEAFQYYCSQHHVPYQLVAYHSTKEYDLDTKLLLEIFHTVQDSKAKKCGIAFSNDNHGVMFLNIMLQNQFKVPTDCEIIGFDDSTIAKQAIIPLTTIKQDKQMLAKQAIDLLLDSNPKQLHRMVAVELIKRSTTS